MVVTSEPEVTDLLTEREDGNNPGTVQGQAEECSQLLWPSVGPYVQFAIKCISII